MTEPTETDTRPLRERLTDELGQVQASDLGAHVKRGAVVVIDDSLELLDVAVAVAEDTVDLVKPWIESKKMRNPTQAEIDTWEASPEAAFRSVIVRPYVLVQPLSS